MLLPARIESPSEPIADRVSVESRCKSPTTFIVRTPPDRPPSRTFTPLICVAGLPFTVKVPLVVLKTIVLARVGREVEAIHMKVANTVAQRATGESRRNLDVISCSYANDGRRKLHS